MDIKAQRLEILQQVEKGEIALDEASRWLAALDRVKSKNGAHPETDNDRPVDPPVIMAGAATPVVKSTPSGVLNPPPPVVEIRSIEPERAEPAQVVEVEPGFAR